jgi:hypothetical protein
MLSFSAAAGAVHGHAGYSPDAAVAHGTDFTLRSYLLVLSMLCVDGLPGVVDVLWPLSVHQLYAPPPPCAAFCTFCLLRR